MAIKKVPPPADANLPMRGAQRDVSRSAVFVKSPAVPPAKKIREGPEFSEVFTKRGGALQKSVLNGSNLGELAEDEKHGL